MLVNHRPNIIILSNLKIVCLNKTKSSTNYILCI